MNKSKRTKLQSCLTFLLLVFLFALVISIVFAFVILQNEVKNIYGPPETNLSLSKKILYTTKLYLAGDKLFLDQNGLTENYYFEIVPGETVGQISYRLKSTELITDQQIFEDFLIYKGYDRRIQSGYFRIEPDMNGIEIAEKITSLVPDKVRFNILPGWRVEEIATILPQSGLNINPEEFLALVHNPSPEWVID